MEAHLAGLRSALRPHESRRAWPVAGQMRACRPSPCCRSSRALGMAGPQPGLQRNAAPGGQSHHRTARGRGCPDRARGFAKGRRGALVLVAGSDRERSLPGEVCTLRWCDVDLDKRFVRIERSVSATASAGVVIKSTKTGKPRVVSLTTQAVDALLQRRGHAAQVASTAGRDLDESELIFATDALGQQPWRPDMVTGCWTRLRREIGAATSGSTIMPTFALCRPFREAPVHRGPTP